LVDLGDLHVLQAVRAVHTDLTVVGTSKHDWRVAAELDGSLGGVDLVLRGILVEVGQHWREHVSLQVPNLNSTVVGHRGEDGRRLWRPVDIIDLLFQALNLVAGQLGARGGLGVPNLDGPIVRAREEDWAQLLVEEWIAPELVDGTHMTQVRVQVLLGVAH